VALVSFGEHMGHFLVFAQLSGCQELLRAQIASESRVLATVELGPVVVETNFVAEIPRWSTFKADVDLYTKLEK
jgi:hypothetical protein